MTRPETMKTGDTVQFKAPTDDAEARERFIVLEMRGDRVLVEFICSMPLRPTMVYPASDLTQA